MLRLDRSPFSHFSSFPAEKIVLKRLTHHCSRQVFSYVVRCLTACSLTHSWFTKCVFAELRTHIKCYHDIIDAGVTVVLLNNMVCCLIGVESMSHKSTATTGPHCYSIHSLNKKAVGGRLKCFKNLFEN